MANQFTMLWSKEYCSYVNRTLGPDEPLWFIWGGWNMATDFVHYGIGPGDLLYPIAVRQGELHVLARMHVTACVSTAQFQELHPSPSQATYHACASQVLLGCQASTVQLHRPLPTIMLDRLTYLSAKGQRKPKHVAAGKVLNTIALQGIYRLSPQSAADFAELFDERLGEG